LIYESNNKLVERYNSIIALRNKMAQIFYDMNFKALYDQKKDLFHIGYDYSNRKMSESYYDLLASESRQTSLIAIAKGDVPTKHWFKLARPVGISQEKRILLSWSGTMFEYLMPMLIMKNYQNTIIDETYHGVVDVQILHGRKKGTPWGISESGYYDFDFDMYYQYKAFGIAKLGLRFASDDNVVISPYASMLCLNISPSETLKNYKILKKINAVSKYGLYEAVDFAKKNNGKRRYSIVKSYMAHHQGMILASLTNFLYSNIFQDLFHASKLVMSTESLLKEKSVPRNVLIENYNKQREFSKKNKNNAAEFQHYDLSDQQPKAHILSNGKYSCMLTQFGTGYSRYKDILVNTWSTDYLREVSGNFIYVNDQSKNRSWTIGYAPSYKKPDDYNVVFDDFSANFKRKDGDVISNMNICVSCEQSIEIRRVVIENKSNKDKKIDVSCVLLPMLSSIQDYISHPAFSSLFIEKMDIDILNAIVIRKRSRDIKKELFLGLKCVCENDAIISKQVKMQNVYSRLDQYQEIKMQSHDDMSSGSKTLLAIRSDFLIRANSSNEICFIITVSDHLKGLLNNLNAINALSQVKPVFELAKNANIVKKEYGHISYLEKQLSNAILSNIIFSLNGLDIDRQASVVQKDHLFRYGLNENTPFFTIVVKKAADLKRVKLAIIAFDYFRKHSIPINLVILDCNTEIYMSTFKQKIANLISRYAREGKYFVKTKIVYVNNDNTVDADVASLLTCANLILDASKSIKNQLVSEEQSLEVQKFEKYRDTDKKIMPLLKKSVTFDNGFGGFSNDGTEYIIHYTKDTKLPSAWVNVLANKQFGSVVSTEGGGYTWANNSRLFRITPFKNNDFNDVAVEGLYLRDEKFGFSKNLMPDKSITSDYRVTHGKGYSLFENNEIFETKLKVFVPSQKSAKISSVTIKNSDAYDREFTLYYYFEPVLGENNFWKKCLYTELLNQNIVTASSLIDNVGFEGKAYITCFEQSIDYTSDKYELFAQGECYPKMLKTKGLSNRLGMFNNTCIAISVTKKIMANQSITLNFVMGFEKNDLDIIDTIKTLSDDHAIKTQFSDMTKSYGDIFENIQVKTPEKSFDHLINSWLLYQTNNSRLLGKSGYYQSGGAFGFRDQLQDVLSMLYVDSNVVKDQLIICSKRQFLQGDVLHWWHKQATGVRTKISDDLLFLPYVLSEYLLVTEDFDLLDHETSYLESLDIAKNDEDLYFDFKQSDIFESLYHHCMRAMDHAFKIGQNGLLLIKGGDWNDGMNLVGIKGKGESVWLSMFYVDVATRFIDISKYKNDMETVDKLKKQIDMLKVSIDKSWDGKWYRRGYYDNGDPLGSEKSDECKIDILSQSWAVISKACDQKKCDIAFDSAYHLLVEEQNSIIKLLTPAFNQSKNNPGYIKSYLKGVRENGGQYTHAAAWYIISAAMLNKNDYAFKLFDMINPIKITSTSDGVLKYKGEPYVIAGDVYSGNEAGRAGWTWYTGSASWLYRAGIEHILGFKRRGNRLFINPCIPKDWDGFSIHYKYKSSVYIIEVKNIASGQNKKGVIKVDNTQINEEYINLIDDGKKHIACISFV
jgi:cyclic beta-1,2-glucan synthetase